MRTVIRSRRVLRSAHQEQPTPGTITVDGHSIVAVDTEPAPGDAVMDVGDRLVTPAFINGHTHLSMCAFRGLGLDALDGNIVYETYFRLENGLLPEDVRAFTRMGAYESLLAGVGAVWDHYYYAEAVAAALTDVGLSGVIAPTLQDLAGPGVPHLEAQLAATVAIAQDQKMADAGVFAALGPHATDTVSDALWKRIVDLADRHGLVMHAHVAQSIEEYVQCVEQLGLTPVERLDRLGVLDAGAGALMVHGLYVSHSDLQRLRPDHNVLGYCPFSQIQFGFPAAVEHWWEAGVPFVVGTDAGACNDSMSVQQELRLLAGGRAFAVTPSPAGVGFRATGALSDALQLDAERRTTRRDRGALAAPETLLGTVWAVPGRLHPQLALGELRPGARASLCVWDLSHPACWPATDPLRALTFADLGGALHTLM
ncbi:MAG: amidohydrolase family protein, partial [Myxococcales bacterium]|nr:amidohydrolase family protein [Myxococcales bacterium]